jgi:carbon-monoxide dehydrogenase small subunit
MKTISLTLNGTEITGAVEPSLHLADFIREHRLLTGTHIGCEHGVCGACTLLVDDQPVRSCITLAVTCEGADIRSVEGLDDDPIAARLRAVFKAEHGLQCGYCTPGMLVTARDIVLRLPDADEARIRLELSGNLCRCTGYAGIVRAIRRVLAETPLATAPEVLPPVPHVRFPGSDSAPDAPVSRARPEPQAEPSSAAPEGMLQQTLDLALPLETVWRAIKNPTLIAACVPGVTLSNVAGANVAVASVAGASADGTRLEGQMVVGLGPIRARFSGIATVTYRDEDHSGGITSEGRDGTTGTLLRARAAFQVTASGPAATRVALSIDYQLRGALAQFGRGAIVQALAQELTQQVAQTLEARLRGDPAGSSAPIRLSAGRLMLATLLRRLRKLLTGC